MKKEPRIGGCTLPPVVGSPNSDTPRVTNVLAGMVEPLAKANSSEEFTAALKDALQRLIAEAKKLERELNLAEARLWIAKQALVACRDWRGGLGMSWPMERAATALRMIDASNKSSA